MNDAANLIVLVLVSSCFGLGAMVIARGKGYSRIFGFCLGFFGSLFGIIIAAVLPARSGEASRQKAKRKTETKRAATQGGTSWYDTY
jgi:uncharacterized membrane protein YdjX (TVP38/TMEM64 family)